MKDMNWPERVAYLENQLADSDRENQRLSEFIKGLPDGDETPAQLAEAQRFRRSTMYWHERAMKAEARLAEATACIEDVLDADGDLYSMDFDRYRAFLAPDNAPAVEQRLWLWRNGDHFLAFEHLYPCFTPGGDPMTLGEPVGYAIVKRSFDRAPDSASHREDGSHG